MLSELGAGAMGVVYVAYDPELDRKLALKLVRPDPTARRESIARARLLREAQALARLNHPNVVSVHDAGTHEGQVWIAMELVEGQTLTAWAAQARRSWPEVVAVMSAAGRGMVEAHSAGLLHRDFKPDNVMLGDDGRVRVMDFGLVRHQGPSSSDGEASSELDSSHHEPLDSALTQAGALLGTPAYMAPELFEGEVSEHTDQFAFCVALWELLFGERPFRGDTIMELAAAVVDGTLRSPSRPADVPAWLRQICIQGLSVDPSQRFSSMQALLEAIGSHERRSRTRRWAVVAGLVLAGGLAGLGLQQYRRAQAIDQCRADGRVIEQAWGATTRERIHAALVGTNVGHAPLTAERVTGALDTYAARWAEVREGACTDHRVHGRGTSVLLEQARWCLDDRLAEFEALTDRLATRDEQLVHHALTATLELSSLDACTDTAHLDRQPLPSEAVRAEAQSVRDRLSHARALGRAALFEESLHESREALERARELAWPPLVAAAQVSVGNALAENGSRDEAQQMLREAYFEAARADLAEPAAAAAIALASALRSGDSRYDDALLWADLAEVQLARQTDDDETLNHARLHALRSKVHENKGRFDEAEALIRKAIALQEATLGADSPLLARSLATLAEILRHRRRLDEALALGERAREGAEQALGPDHPAVAHMLRSMANTHYSRGEYEQMVRLDERALEIQQASLALDHPTVLATLNNLAEAYRLTGEFERTRDIHELVLARWLDAGDGEHLNIAMSLNNLGLYLHRQKEYDDAYVLHMRALRIREQALGPDHPEVGFSLLNAANSLMYLPEPDRRSRAHAAVSRALSIFERVFGPDHINLSYPLSVMVKVATEDGDLDRAVALAERANAIRENDSAPSDKLAHSRFLLARTLLEAGRPPGRAIELARLAAQEYRRSGKAGALARVESWLDRHPPHSPDRP